MGEQSSAGEFTAEIRSLKLVTTVGLLKECGGIRGLEDC